ncbi:MAG: DNA ligase, partial [Actinobacteria bacterium]|nr:DNA ligase [Actinomycetota bacterium]NIS34378.1 DNA ligase [Actinomycetota bacterium]NIU69154.1 DNA ligase [Actinomycetota bacterium]NIW31016.1 DNA ligase [Actinomycetota bacterium]NIX23409.1 DNA ligase [Actinomycetota bacterium]
MLAVAGELPADDGAWSYEMKWDGVRVLAAVSPDGVRLTGRSGADMSVAYPELAGLADAVGAMRPVLDGEVVVLRPDGTTDFGTLAPRMHVRSPERAAALAAASPVTYLIFDVLELAGSSTVGLSLAERRELLEKLELAGPHWQLSPAFGGPGAD